jgi:hypothetical protein
VKGEGHFAGYLYGTECACPTGRWSVFPPSFKFSGCLITMDVFSLRFFVVEEEGSYSGLFVRYRVHMSGQVFPLFFNFL